MVVNPAIADRGGTGRPLFGSGQSDAAVRWPEGGRARFVTNISSSERRKSLGGGKSSAFTPYPFLPPLPSRRPNRRPRP